MRALLQRVSEAGVMANGTTVARIGQGLLVFIGVRHDDSSARAEKLADKVTHLRIFDDAEGKMNLSVMQISGEMLIVSQFTLYGDTRKGTRPSYSEAAPAEIARPIYEHFVESCRGWGIRVSAGVFQAEMKVSLLNDGPVTLICTSEI